MIDHSMRRITQKAGIITGWEAKQDQGYIPDTFTYSNDKIADSLDPPTEEPKLLPPQIIIKE